MEEKKFGIESNVKVGDNVFCSFAGGGVMLGLLYSHGETLTESGVNEFYVIMYGSGKTIELERDEIFYMCQWTEKGLQKKDDDKKIESKAAGQTFIDSFYKKSSNKEWLYGGIR